ncbi:MFS family permease [Lipingzhangella halophila]|uniref:MFS family permease n=1 Tax=Lipingzhangella halophila TaxID=1783352 RepID=A0A7W7RC14_9ACTN|nr:MFS transporter [Lipingzhangella halophila]MBB4929211.1 MFS family permease [Lipingzhangella halophila]
MSGPTFLLSAHEVRDLHGRRYRLGETDRELLGYSRAWIAWAAGLAMLAAGVGQYGYAVLLPAITATQGWQPREAVWVLAVWAACQAATVYPVARLRSRARIPPAALMAIGAVLCATGLVTLGVSETLALVILAHAVLGGIGAGLVYGTCVSVVSRWYPEHPARTHFASGAFAVGSIPIVVLAERFTAAGTPGSYLGVVALVVLLLVGAAALVLKDPPAHWWPARIDPHLWATDKSVNPGLRRNRPAIRRYAPGEVLRCPESALLYAAMTCASAVALFDLAFVGVFAVSSGWGPGFAAFAVGALAGASGVSRAVAGWAGIRFGRARTVVAALLIAGVAQAMILVGGVNGVALLLVLGCLCAGTSAGICFALLPELVDDHFGDREALPNFGLFYGAKAVGGLAGVGLAAVLLVPYGFTAGFAVAALVSLAGALLTGLLRRPGMPRVTVPDSRNRPRETAPHRSRAA